MARMVLLDWQRGRLPYFCLPALDNGPAQVSSRCQLRFVEQSTTWILKYGPGS